MAFRTGSTERGETMPASRLKVRGRARSTMIASIGLFIGTVFLMVFLGTLVDHNGTPIVQHFSPIIVQIVSTSGPVVVALLPYLIRTHKASEASKEQLQNDHAKNYREEYDERHGAVMQALGMLDRKVGSLVSDMGSMQASVMRLWSAANQLDSSVKGLNARTDDLESTIDTRNRGE